MEQSIELLLQLAILVLVIVIFIRHSSVKCVCNDKSARAPAGYTNRQSVYEMESPRYPEIGVVPSQADAYQKLDNCYQNGGVYDFNTNICRFDYQNMGVIRDQGFSNPRGKFVQEFAYQANKTPINSMLHF